MNSAAEVVQVQLVSNPWVSIVLLATALLVSVGTLVWTIWMRQREGARLKVSASWSMLVGVPDEGRELISIEAVNVGRTGTTVLKSLRFGAGEGRHLHPFSAFGPGPEFPIRLGPGESASILVDPQQVALTCGRESLVLSKLYPVAATGHGDVKGRMAGSALQLIRRFI